MTPFIFGPSILNPQQPPQPQLQQPPQPQQGSASVKEVALTTKTLTHRVQHHPTTTTTTTFVVSGSTEGTAGSARIKRRYPIGHAFWDDGDQLRHPRALNVLYATDYLEEEGDYVCVVAGCGKQLSSVAHFEDHYNSRHKWVCTVCKRVYPKSRLLELHVLETHDTLFPLLAKTRPMFECLVDGCELKFNRDEDRKRHLMDVHRYPKNFRFHPKHTYPTDKSHNTTTTTTTDINNTQPTTTHTNNATTKKRSNKPGKWHRKRKQDKRAAALAEQAAEMLAAVTVSSTTNTNNHYNNNHTDIGSAMMDTTVSAEQTTTPHTASVMVVTEEEEEEEAPTIAERRVTSGRVPQHFSFGRRGGGPRGRGRGW
eukprot:TRINITY_DN6191_c0_g2_i1.p1 TRINITY_DN6191_c0_g2~~TRINITY_DN6191_c0_g2_i1.p1  ORF type:complete len:368 (-),score=110.88 TRINITY_DN6191_c0_g2_i1:15-1118(-)